MLTIDITRRQAWTRALTRHRSLRVGPLMCQTLMIDPADDAALPGGWVSIETPQHGVVAHGDLRGSEGTLQEVFQRNAVEQCTCTGDLQDLEPSHQIDRRHYTVTTMDRIRSNHPPTMLVHIRASSTCDERIPSVCALLLRH